MLSAEDSPEIEESSRSSWMSHSPSPSESVGAEDEFAKSVPHRISSSLDHPSPSMSPSSPAVAKPSCLNTVSGAEFPGWNVYAHIFPWSLSSAPTQSAPPSPSISVFSQDPSLLCRAYVPSAVPARIRVERSAPIAMSMTPVSETSTESVTSSEFHELGLPQLEEHEV